MSIITRMPLLVGLLALTQLSTSVFACDNVGAASCLLSKTQQRQVIHLTSRRYHLARWRIGKVVETRRWVTDGRAMIAALLAYSADDGSPVSDDGSYHEYPTYLVVLKATSGKALVPVTMQKIRSAWEFSGTSSLSFKVDRYVKCPANMCVDGLPLEGHTMLLAAVSESMSHGYFESTLILYKLNGHSLKKVLDMDVYNEQPTGKDLMDTEKNTGVVVPKVGANGYTELECSTTSIHETADDDYKDHVIGTKKVTYTYDGQKYRATAGTPTVK